MFKPGAVREVQEADNKVPSLMMLSSSSKPERMRSETGNLLRIVIYIISYIRRLFPEKYFNDIVIPDLEMKMKRLNPMDAESQRLINWMEQGVYDDALRKKYLKKVLFCICEDKEGAVIEEYSFSFIYGDFCKENVCMNGGNKKSSATLTANDMFMIEKRDSVWKMIRTLFELTSILYVMPSERTVLMKFLYYDHITPQHYEPPFFRRCSESESNNIWTKNQNHFRMKVGKVKFEHWILVLKVKTILAPCEDENEYPFHGEEASLEAILDQDDSFLDNEVLIEDIVERMLDGVIYESDIVTQVLGPLPVLVDAGSIDNDAFSISRALEDIESRDKPLYNNFIRSGRRVSRLEPIASVETGVLGGNHRHASGGDSCSSSKNKRSQKTSMVKEPIHQYGLK